MNKIYKWLYYKWVIIQDKAVVKMIRNKPNYEMKILIRFLKESNLYSCINFNDFEEYNIFYILKQRLKQGKSLMEEMLPFVIDRKHLDETNQENNTLTYVCFLTQWKIICYLDPIITISNKLDNNIIDLGNSYLRQNQIPTELEPLVSSTVKLYEIFLKQYKSNVLRRH